MPDAQPIRLIHKNRVFIWPKACCFRGEISRDIANNRVIDPHIMAGRFTIPGPPLENMLDVLIRLKREMSGVDRVHRGNIWQLFRPQKPREIRRNIQTRRCFNSERRMRQIGYRHVLL